MTTHTNKLDAQIYAIISAYNEALQSIANNHKTAYDLCYAKYNALDPITYNADLLSIDNDAKLAVSKNSAKLEKAIADLCIATFEVNV
jgi:hypothetical protein